MKNLRELNHWRDRALERMAMGGGLPLDEMHQVVVGCFRLPSPIDRVELRCIVSAVDGWDHVSVSRKNRCPNWPEMSFVKDAFFLPEECAMQLHVPEADHVNNHAHCLHLWRPHALPIPRPPAMMVGVKGLSQDEVRALGRLLGPEEAIELIRDRALEAAT